jgi:hypothetical protein
MFDFGIIFDAFQGENASLGFSGKFGLSFQKLNDYVWSNGTYKHATYSATVPSIFVGIEPAYLFSENFALFSRFGINLQFMPNSNFIDTSNPTYNLATDSLPLKKRDDAHTIITTDGLTLGVRYYF